MSVAKILIVEDDVDLSNIVRLNLEHEEYECKCAFTCQETKNEIEAFGPDLVLLDVMLPDGTGTELCKEMRQKYYGPVIFMSCLDDNKTICDALIDGGDDYIIKPIDFDQLKARIAANLRRASQSPQYVKNDNADFIRLKNYCVDKKRHKAFAGSEGDGDEIDLSPIEYSLLNYMIEHHDSLLLYKELYSQIWGSDSLGDFRTVMVHVSNLRKKLEVTGDSGIETVRGAGYIFNL